MKKVATILLAIYVYILIKILVFKDLPTIQIGHVIYKFGGTNADGSANLIPFKSIISYLLGERGLLSAILNVVGNIGLLVPVGFLISFICQKINWKNSLYIAILCGLIIESTQVILHVGIFDIDDVILNALGVMIGFWIYKFIFQKNLEN